MLREIIYDFDGTVSDTYPVFTEAFLELLHRHGITDTYERVYSLLKVSVGYALAQYHLPKNANIEFHKIHSDIMIDRQNPIDGAGEILRYATEHGGKNYIFTHSGKEVRILLEKWGFMPYITDIIDNSYNSVIKRKPSPDGVELLIKNNSMRREECIIIGDRDIDILSGHNARIAGCLFDPEHFYDSFTCEYRVNHLIDLIEIICK